jgi:hypothetical protein
VRKPSIAASACALTVALAGCGDSPDRPAQLPSSGTAYRALDQAHRTAVAASCRDTEAARAHGLAARQLRAVDANALRGEIDGTYFAVAEQRRPVAEVCADVIAFVTPGLRVSFDGAKEARDGTFSVETTSDRRLTLRGRITPAPVRGRVLARREVGRPARRSAAIAPDGRFALPPVALRKVADNSFTVTIQAPPNAPRKVLFSAICLDCLAGGTVPSAS